jgi:peptidoglycan/xylan/chitin deacetylase (PgdA/CDA1 family)
MAVTLLYHDVTPRGDDDSSGFPGAGAARYKLTLEEFAEHLAAIARAAPGTTLRAEELAARPEAGLLLTFDDGGASALAPTADLLEEHGWRGHFFMTTDYVGAPGFLNAAQLRELHARGHVIGSHSCSHPARMALCGREQLLREWRQSREVLADVLGAPVTVASVPGGYYTRAVAEAAAEAGIRVLFNSEPTTRLATVGGCLVVGRYTVYRGTSARAAAALAAGRRLPRWRQAFWWNVKKAAKAVGGRTYLALRERLLRRAYVGGQAGQGRAPASGGR